MLHEQIAFNFVSHVQPPEVSDRFVKKSVSEVRV